MSARQKNVCHTTKIHKVELGTEMEFQLRITDI